jgi:hypothetical protein
MTAATLTLPRFRRNQSVYFIGGLGTIQDQHCESGRWLYLVSMEMGPEPAMGRVGCETSLWLYETDLIALEDSLEHQLVAG